MIYPALWRPAVEKRQGTKSRRRIVRRRCRKRYGDLDTVRAVAIRFEREHNLNVTARMLLYGDLMFLLSVISTT